MLLYEVLAYATHTKTMNLKYQHHRGMINLNYLTDHILCKIFKINLSISSKNMK